MHVTIEFINGQLLAIHARKIRVSASGLDVFEHDDDSSFSSFPFSEINLFEVDGNLS